MNNEDFYSADFTNSLPPALKNDPDMMALAQTISAQLQTTAAEVRKNIIYARIDELDEATLDVLAYDLHVDWYDYSYPIEVKRRTIRDVWRAHGGDPYKCRVVIGATEAGITADRQAAVLDRVRFYKNLRSHLEAISYKIEKRTAVKVAAVHAIGQRVEGYPYLARNMESHGGFYCGGYTQYGRKLAVFPNK